MNRSPRARSGAVGATPLSPLIHGRVRLLILSDLLSSPEPATFTQLRKRLQLTDGTLSVHLSRLAKGGMVKVEKRFVGKRPQTLVRITAAGRRRFAAYVKELRAIVPGLRS